MKSTLSSTQKQIIQQVADRWVSYFEDLIEKNQNSNNVLKIVEFALTRMLPGSREEFNALTDKYFASTPETQGAFKNFYALYHGEFSEKGPIIEQAILDNRLGPTLDTEQIAQAKQEAMKIIRLSFKTFLFNTYLTHDKAKREEVLEAKDDFFVSNLQQTKCHESRQRSLSF